jgi:hypothetical protein
MIVKRLLRTSALITRSDPNLHVHPHPPGATNYGERTSVTSPIGGRRTDPTQRPISGNASVPARGASGHEAPLSTATLHRVYSSTCSEMTNASSTSIPR